MKKCRIIKEIMGKSAIYSPKMNHFNSYKVVHEFFKAKIPYTSVYK